MFQACRNRLKSSAPGLSEVYDAAALQGFSCCLHLKSFPGLNELLTSTRVHLNLLIVP